MLSCQNRHFNKSLTCNSKQVSYPTILCICIQDLFYDSLIMLEITPTIWPHGVVYIVFLVWLHVCANDSLSVCETILAHLTGVSGFTSGPERAFLAVISLVTSSAVPSSSDRERPLLHSYTHASLRQTHYTLLLHSLFLTQHPRSTLQLRQGSFIAQQTEYSLPCMFYWCKTCFWICIAAQIIWSQVFFYWNI